MRSLVTDRRGAVYVEFLIAIIPFFFLVLCIGQTVLLQFADIAVERAANAAARSAVVVLDDDPRYYRDEPRNTVTPGSGRLEVIRQSAANVLSALPGTRGLDRSARLVVAFPDQPGSDVLRSGFGPDQMVTVRVSYLFRCSIPMARTLMCRDRDGGGGTFFRMRAEASLPNQGSHYSYGGGVP